jgi:phytanoyl-CoA hydroxylase
MSSTVCEKTTLKKQYEKDGFVIAKSIFSQEELQRAKSFSQQRNRSNSAGVEVIASKGLPESLRNLVCHDKVKDILFELLGTRVDFLSVKPVYKNENITFGTPWHQDWQYWQGNNHKLSVWVALDDANIDNGCLKVIPGSHTKVEEHQKIQGDFANRIDEDLSKTRETQDVILKKGDAVFFHDLLLHASHGNTSGKDRWSFISTYRDASREDEGCDLYNNLWSEPLAL